MISHTNVVPMANSKKLLLESQHCHSSWSRAVRFEPYNRSHTEGDQDLRHRNRETISEENSPTRYCSCRLLIIHMLTEPFLPSEKLVVHQGKNWCTDVFDKFVIAGQSVTLGESVIRQYTPACHNQSLVILGIFCSDSGEQEVQNVNSDI